MRAILAWLIVGVCFSSSSKIEAQQPAKIPRIGVLGGISAAAVAARVETFRQGLRELGYVEGKNIVIEYRFAEGKLDRLHELAAELVRLKVDVIVTTGASSTRPAKEATTTIPIVMAQDPDPVGNGFVASLARPGGNITGLSRLAPEISGKQLELLKETVPKLSRVAVLGDANLPGYPQMSKELELAAAALKLRLQFLRLQDPQDIVTSFRAAAIGSDNAALVLETPLIVSRRTQVAVHAVKNHLPTIFPVTEYVEDGGLMSYGASLNDLARRAATYVDKILKGRSPADLPVEQPIKFEFIVNLKAAKQIGLTIPPNVLARADRVIR